MTTTVADVAAELGRPTPAPESVESVRLSRWIEDAHLLIRTRLGDLSELDQDLLDMVVRVSVAEHAKNPDGQESFTTSIDDGSVTKRWRNSGADGRLSIRDDLWALLDPSTAGAFSARLVGEPDRPGCRWPSWVINGDCR